MLSVIIVVCVIQDATRCSSY